MTVRTRISKKERRVILGAFLFLGGLALLARASKVSPISEGVLSEPQKISIKLSGAVKDPGTYECEVGTPLGLFVKNIGYRADADRKAIPQKRLLLVDQEISIPRKTATEKKPL